MAVFNRLFLTGFLSLSLSGCLWFSAKTETMAPVSNNSMSVEFLKPGALASGGSILVEPFKAGIDAEATPVLDRFSLAIVKAAMETVESDGGRLRNQAENADFLLEGHIQEFKGPGRTARMMLKKDLIVRIQGQLRDLRTGEVVALISDRRKTRNNSADLDMTAYSLGQEMIQGLVEQGGRE